MVDEVYLHKKREDWHSAFAYNLYGKGMMKDALKDIIITWCVCVSKSGWEQHVSEFFFLFMLLLFLFHIAKERKKGRKKKTKELWKWAKYLRAMNKKFPFLMPKEKKKQKTALTCFKAAYFLHILFYVFINF